MLETVRAYGLEQLVASGELDTAQRRHAAWFVVLAEQFDRGWRGPTPQVWLDRLEAEHDSMRAALGWTFGPSGDPELGLRLAGALWRFWELRGYLTEGPREGARGWHACSRCRTRPHRQPPGRRR